MMQTAKAVTEGPWHVRVGAACSRRTGPARIYHHGLVAAVRLDQVVTRLADARDAAAPRCQLRQEGSLLLLAEGNDAHAMERLVARAHRALLTLACGGDARVAEERLRRIHEDGSATFGTWSLSGLLLQPPTAWAWNAGANQTCLVQGSRVTVIGEHEHACSLHRLAAHDGLRLVLLSRSMEPAISIDSLGRTLAQCTDPQAAAAQMVAAAGEREPHDRHAALVAAVEREASPA